MSGPAGQTGSQGLQGNPGVAGLAGANGTVITTVQFCKGVTATYPSVFPEYGLVINGGIYAVYSANDGYLAYLPPGYYSSNAIGSACNFTVNPDATISN